MRHTIFSLFFLLLFISQVNSVSTRYLSDFKFDTLENYDFSNVSLTENGSIELSRETTNLYSSPEMFWSLEKTTDGFLIGTGEKASLVSVQSKGSEIVYNNSDYILFSDIALMNDSIYLSAVPKGSLLILDMKYKLKKKTAFSNEYLWDIIPGDKGYFILAGNPAAVYYFNNNDQLQWSISVPGVNNLLKGVLDNNILYIEGDNSVLYALPVKETPKEKRLPALASFDNPISDFIILDGKIYIVTAVKDQKKTPQSPASEGLTLNDDENTQSSQVQNDTRKTKFPAGKSGLYVIDPDGNTEILFEKNNIRFSAISISGKNLVLATDKPGGYYEYSLTDKTKRYTSIGNGKFVRFLDSPVAPYAVMLEPSRIIKFLTNYNHTGYFISSAVDTGNVSKWGNPITGISVSNGNSIDFSTRSSLVYQDDIWEAWKPVAKNGVQSPPGQYLQYKADFSSDGRSTPYFKSMAIPFIQKNHSPVVNKVTITYNNNNIIRISWDASDPDKDTIVYDVYISLNGKDWIKLNDKPMEDSPMDISKDLLPEGRYRVKVIANDSRSNNRDEVRTGELVSDPFVMDNRAPDLSSLSTRKLADGVWVQFTAKDSLSPVFDASYNINGGKWFRIQPESGIYDSQEENFFFRVDTGYPALLQIRVTDIYGNSSVKGLYLDKE